MTETAITKEIKLSLLKRTNQTIGKYGAFEVTYSSRYLKHQNGAKKDRCDYVEWDGINFTCYEMGLGKTIQAISRVYRMGQTRDVLVYRLLTKGSIDESMVDLIDIKQDIFDTYANDSALQDAFKQHENDEAIKSKQKKYSRRRHLAKRLCEQDKNKNVLFPRSLENFCNWQKARRQKAVYQAKVANQRRDYLHKLTTHLVRQYDVIVMEDLKTKNLQKNHHLAKAIANNS